MGDGPIFTTRPTIPVFAGVVAGPKNTSCPSGKWREGKAIISAVDVLEVSSMLALAISAACAAFVGGLSVDCDLANR